MGTPRNSIVVGGEIGLTTRGCCAALGFDVAKDEASFAGRPCRLTALMMVDLCVVCCVCCVQNKQLLYPER
jgi:hypothetical protein